jgi:hypothetical protein
LYTNLKLFSKIIFANLLSMSEAGGKSSQKAELQEKALHGVAVVVVGGNCRLPSMMLALQDCVGEQVVINLESD